MSQNIDYDALYEKFINSLEKRIVCPYCGDDNQLDPPLLCCGEVHAELMHEYNDELYSEHELDGIFDSWLQDLELSEQDKQYDNWKDSQFENEEY